MTWVSDPQNLAFVLAVLVALAFVILALKPREHAGAAIIAEPAQAAAIEPEIEEETKAPEPEPEPEPEPPPRVTAFDFLAKSGVKEWNEARRRGEYADADFADLGTEFRSKAKGSKIWGRPIDLHDPEHRLMLREINLAGAAFGNNCDLERADLRGADLTEASLQGAHLERALLSNARLVDADLSGARLTNAVLANANLRGANLEGAVLDGANLAWADLRDARGSRRELERLTNLYGARLAGASFDGKHARWLIGGRNLLSKKPILRR